MEAEARRHRSRFHFGMALLVALLLALGSSTEGTEVDEPEIHDPHHGATLHDEERSFARSADNGASPAHDRQVTLVLRDVDVVDFSNGIRNAGSVALRGTSRVVADSADGGAYGVLNLGRLDLGGTSLVGTIGFIGIRNKGTVVMRQRSHIEHYRFRGGGRAAVVNRGRFEMRDASEIARSGESSVVINRGRFVVRGTSSIHDNWAGYGVYGEKHGSKGGAVRNSGTLLLLDASSIHDNTAEYDSEWGKWPGVGGGGVHNSGTLRMAGTASIHDNSRTQWPRWRRLQQPGQRPHRGQVRSWRQCLGERARRLLHRVDAQTRSSSGHRRSPRMAAT